MVFGTETGSGVGRRRRIRIGFVGQQCFKFGVKELWRDKFLRGSAYKLAQ